MDKKSRSLGFSICHLVPVQVSFSADAHRTPTTSRNNVPLLPKHNSGVLISGPSEEWNLRIDFENNVILSVHLFMCMRMVSVL